MNTNEIRRLQQRINRLEVLIRTLASAASAGKADNDTVPDLGAIYYSDDSTYLYATYGRDGAWTAYRWDGETRDSASDTTGLPTTLTELEAISW